MRIAVVTGGSSGVGAEFVRLLQEKNIDEIWAVARNEHKLAALAERCPKVRTFSVDLAETFRGEAEGAENILFRAFREERPEIVWLINSAGYGKFGRYDELGDADELGMIALNAGALVAVTRAALPYMRPGAKIVNLSSCASFQPLPDFNVYAATKAFVQYYSRALAEEVGNRGITVTAVCPSWMRTPFFEVAESSRGSARVTNFTGTVDTAKVVKKAVRDAEKGRKMSVYGFFAKSQRLAAKVLPKQWIEKIWMRMQKNKSRG